MKITTHSLEDYKRSFEVRYRGDKRFQTEVHSYLKLGRSDKVKLKFYKTFMGGAYTRRTNEIILQYATHVYERTKKAEEVLRNASAAGAKAKQLAQEKKTIASQSEKVKSLESAVADVQQSSQTAIDGVTQDYNLKKTEVEQELQLKKAEASGIDPLQLAQDKLKEHLLLSGTVLQDDYGRFTLNDEKIVERLQDGLLDETLRGLARSGKGNIKAAAKAAYVGLFERYGVMNDMSEIVNVDWHQTEMNMALAGRESPIMEDFVVAKYKTPTFSEIGVDTAICADYSGSMKERMHANKMRWEIAQEMAGATAAFMRQLAPSKNTVYLSTHSARSVIPRTHVEFIKLSYPDDGTPTHLALDWLRTTLPKDKLGVAYLVSDGEPNEIYLEATYEAAKKFRDLDNILLRIFLVDGTESAKQTVKKIGQAAGPKTRVMIINSSKLAGDAVIDITKTLGELKSVSSL